MDRNLFHVQVSNLLVSFNSVHREVNVPFLRLSAINIKISYRVDRCLIYSTMQDCAQISFTQDFRTLK